VTAGEQAVCPLDWRYGTEEVRALLSRRALLRKMVEVEAAILKGLEEAGLAPKGCWQEVLKVDVDPAEVDELEKKLGHDVAALAELLSERVGGECGKYVHLGATSYDVVDTAWALVARDAIGALERKLSELIEELLRLAKEHADTLTVGRTHGRHALPTTFGFKMANYAYELARSLERLRCAKARLVKAKLSGAVGTMAGWLGRGLVVEKAAAELLGLEPHAISTQVAPRDGFAELLAALAIMGSQLDRLALEVRELMRDEIAEVFVDFGEVGSSAMPHKRNPAVAERVSGLARILRGLAVTALENIPLMHERDLTNSAPERIAVPHAILVADQMLSDALALAKGLKVDAEAMRRNLELTKGAVASECLLVKLVLKGGLPRPKAHEALRKLARQAQERSEHLREALQKSELASLLSAEDVEECFDYSKYLGSYKELIERAERYARRALEGGGAACA